MSEQRKFTVKRSKWLRGAASYTAPLNGGVPFNSACLLRKDGMQCCLGFVAEQCGVPRDALLDIGEPCVVEHDAEVIEGVLVSEDEGGTSNTELSQDAMEINDDRWIDDTERERRLTALFAEHGYALEFTE